MAYLGNVPAQSFISFERQVFTIVNSQTAYTLSHSVTNENDIRLVVNNVVQEPGSGKAYTATGTTLTLSAALTNGTDEMYCVFLGRAVGTVNAPAGSVGTAQLAADAVTNAKVDSSVITGQTAETSIATDDTILIHDTSASALRKMTRANFVSGVGETNSPNFHAYDAEHVLTSTTWTKINVATEVFNNGSAYDTSTSKFTVPSGEAGVYFFSGIYRMENDSGSAFLKFYKNGSALNNWVSESHGSAYFSVQQNILVNLSAGDYIEMYGYINVGNTNGITNISFQGFKVSS
jgi:hypothetical protein